MKENIRKDSTLHTRIRTQVEQEELPALTAQARQQVLEQSIEALYGSSSEMASINREARETILNRTNHMVECETDEERMWRENYADVVLARLHDKYARVIDADQSQTLSQLQEDTRVALEAEVRSRLDHLISHTEQSLAEQKARPRT